MFSKKKKRLEISGPSNFEHRVHTGYDQQEQKFTGLPRQWQGLIEESAKRPKPLVDPACITAIQHGSQKVKVSEAGVSQGLPDTLPWLGGAPDTPPKSSSSLGSFLRCQSLRAIWSLQIPPHPVSPQVS